MPNLVRAATCLAAALVFAACSGSSASAPPPSPSAAASLEATPSPVASAVATKTPATPVPSVAPSTSTGPTSFTSTTYGYSLTVPAGWTVIQATAAWDGNGAPRSTTCPRPTSSSSLPPERLVLWGAHDQGPGGLREGEDRRQRRGPRQHLSGRARGPGSDQDRGRTGTLLAYDCGILINLAVTVHDGIGYLFGFRDVAVHAATDPADRAVFLELLKSVHFPGLIEGPERAPARRWRCPPL